MGYSVYYDGEVSITPPLTEEHAAILMAVVNHEPNEATCAVLAAIANDEDPDLPYHGGLFELSDAKDKIFPEEDESRHGLGRWLRLLQRYFLAPNGYKLDGCVSWTAEDADDRGCYFFKEDQLETVDDRIVNEGPSWLPSYYADDRLTLRLQQMVDSADDTGCSPDLTVVGAEHIEALRKILTGFGIKTS